MGTVTPHFRELYDWLKTYRPDYLEWCKDYARCHVCPLGAVITWKEDTIRSMMEEPLKEKTYEEFVGTLRKRAMDLPEKFSRNAVNIDLFMKAADAIEELKKFYKIMADAYETEVTRQDWIPVTERLPECEWGAEVGNIEWISCGMVFAGCFGRGGKYRDAYFRTWTDGTEGIDAKDADYWRQIQIPEPPKEET